VPRTRRPPTSPAAAATAPRWRLARPVQARSRETVDLFARAAEELLATRPFEEITIQDIVRRAGRPIGSFYARFGSKDALLPYLYQRYHDGLEAVYAARLERIDWKSLAFEETVERVVDFLLGVLTERPWLIRALALFSRTRPEALPNDLARRRRRVIDLVVGMLLEHRSRVAHPDPEAAIRFGVFLVSTVAREKLLFSEAPLSRVTPISRRTLRRELVHTLLAYLTREAAP
jgi:AcrR family transcriptional regulator